MASIFKILKSAVAGNRPTADLAKLPGQLYTNWPDKQLGVGDDTGVPIDLLGVRYHSRWGAYVPEDMVTLDGKIYVCIVAHSQLPHDFVHWKEVYAAVASDNIDGGRAAEVYLLEQLFDGGLA